MPSQRQGISVVYEIWRGQQLVEFTPCDVPFDKNGVYFFTAPKFHRTGTFRLVFHVVPAQFYAAPLPGDVEKKKGFNIKPLEFHVQVRWGEGGVGGRGLGGGAMLESFGKGTAGRVWCASMFGCVELAGRSVFVFFCVVSSSALSPVFVLLGSSAASEGRWSPEAGRAHVLGLFCLLSIARQGQGL